jgi:hypothetical protein
MYFYVRSRYDKMHLYVQGTRVATDWLPSDDGRVGGAVSRTFSATVSSDGNLEVGVRRRGGRAVLSGVAMVGP